MIGKQWRAPRTVCHCKDPAVWDRAELEFFQNQTQINHDMYAEKNDFNLNLHLMIHFGCTFGQYETDVLSGTSGHEL